MKEKKDKSKQKELYEKPMILASYEKEELEEAIQPHDEKGVFGGCGCGGCGCGSGGGF